MESGGLFLSTTLAQAPGSKTLAQVQVSTNVRGKEDGDEVLILQSSMRSGHIKNLCAASARNFTITRRSFYVLFPDTFTIGYIISHNWTHPCPSYTESL